MTMPENINTSYSMQAEKVACLHYKYIRVNNMYVTTGMKKSQFDRAKVDEW